MYAKNVVAHVVMVQQPQFVTTTGKEKLFNVQELSKTISYILKENHVPIIHIQNYYGTKLFSSVLYQLLHRFLNP
jgi:hypothetical protein